MAEPHADTPETPWPRDRTPVVGASFGIGSNQTVTIDTVTDDYVYLSNGKKMRRANP